MYLFGAQGDDAMKKNVDLMLQVNDLKVRIRDSLY